MRHRIPVVMTYHTMYNLYSHYVPVGGKRVSQMVERMAFRVANAVDAVVTPSRVLADYLRERGVRTPLFPIPNGIPVEDFQGGDRRYAHERYGLPRGIPVSSPAGARGEKNIETSLGLFALVRKKQDAALLLVGDGPSEHLRAGTFLGVGDRVFFAGSVPRKRCPMYASADMFMSLPSPIPRGWSSWRRKRADCSVAVGPLE